VFYKSDEKQMVVPKNLTMQFTKDITFWTHKTILQNNPNSLFYNFASDSLDTKIDAQLSYANYQNDSDRLTTNAYFNANTNEMYKK
jgi:hypothetical protein